MHGGTGLAYDMHQLVGARRSPLHGCAGEWSRASCNVSEIPAVKHRCHLPRSVEMGLTKVIGCVSLVPAVLALVLRTHMTWHATAMLTWIAATGAIVATCASDALCTKSTWLLGKSTVTGMW